MNYKKIYNKLCKRGQIREVREDEYYERHHIIPKCMGGDNSKDNITTLTAREHFICHALLAEMYKEGTTEWYKMNLAFKMMEFSSDNQTRYINSRLYELKRKDFSKVMSEFQSGKSNSFYGKIHTEETKQKMRIFNTGKNNPFYDKTHTDEWKSQHSLRMIGENHYLYGKTHSKETKEKISESKKGKTHTEETKKRMSKAKKGTIWICNIETNKTKKIKKDEPIPDGWVRGRKMKW